MSDITDVKSLTPAQQARRLLELDGKWQRSTITPKEWQDYCWLQRQAQNRRALQRHRLPRQLAAARGRVEHLIAACRRAGLPIAND